MKPVSTVPIRVDVVESDPLRFLGFHTILSSEPDFEVRASCIASLLKSTDEAIILMTTNRGAAFHAGMSALKSLRPTARILVAGLGSQDEDILRAVGCGAKGYIAEDAPPSDFAEAIRVLHSGAVWIPGRVLSLFIERVTSSPRRVVAREDQSISDREREVLRLLVAGCSNREIGQELGILERTVKAHITQLMRKVGVQNRISLSVHAVTHSLLANTY